MKLWQKHWKLNTQVEAFETGDDLLLDQKLVWADVVGTLAHAMMLHKIGLLSKKELIQATKGLLTIQKLDHESKFVLSIGDEDVHTKIENYLTDHIGLVGKKIHTGRSRNDQVLTALRLFTKQELFTIWQGIVDLADAFLSFSKQYEYLPMPGYTHMQKAMPSSVGMWVASFVESLLDDCVSLKTAITLVDQSPLGSAAGYGVPLVLDRDYTAKLLGFSKVQKNSLYCQNSRGKIEGVVVASLVSIMQTINKFATDILLFTTSEFGHFTVADELTTGSSIMPQKKNIDVAELLRSKLHVILGHYNAIIGITGNLPLGYNRDFQDTKKPLMEALAVSKQSIAVAKLLVTHLKPNTEKLLAAMTPELFATHKALEQVKQGKTFRDAYQAVTWNDVPSSVQVQKMLKQSVHLGGTGSLGLSALQKEVAAEHNISLKAKKKFTAAMAGLGVVPYEN
jgi:argininosuccinate lyase